MIDDTQRLGVLVRQLQGTLSVRGQATITGTGAGFADVTVNDNLGTTAKLGLAIHHEGGTFTGDVLVLKLQSTTADTTTFRGLTRNAGNITLAQTVLIDYWVWPA